MSMISKFRSRAKASSRRTRNDLARALRTAPTPASREEIMFLANR